MYSSLFCRLYNEFGWNEYPGFDSEMAGRETPLRGGGCGALHAGHRTWGGPVPE